MKASPRHTVHRSDHTRLSRSVADARLHLPGLPAPRHLREHRVPELPHAAGVRLGRRGRSTASATAARTASDRLQRRRPAASASRARSPARARLTRRAIQWGVAEAAKRRLIFELLELGLAGRRRPDVRPALERRRPGHHRPRRRRHHARPGRGRPGPPRADPHRARRALPHRARAPAPRDRPLLPADPRARGLARDRALPRADGRRPRGLLRRRWTATTRTARPYDWRDRYVSAYATMHPWEDWAETFAHYLHIRDVLQTAVAYGVSVSGPGGARRRRRAAVLLPGRRAGRLPRDARRLAAR